MPNENIETLLIAFLPFLLLLAEVWDIVVIGAGLFSMAWVGRQIYMSFRKERRAAEKHGKEQTLLDLQIRTAKRALGEGEDEDKPTPKD